MIDFPSPSLVSPRLVFTHLPGGGPAGGAYSSSSARLAWTGSTLEPAGGPSYTGGRLGS
jgi:hypothetical protein